MEFLSSAEDFYTKLTNQEGIPEEDARLTLKTGRELVQKGFRESGTRKQGLLFGQIQSGKTNNIIMAIACASDLGVRLFIVLTSDNRWLYNQTCGRLREGLPRLLTVDSDGWRNRAMEARIRASHGRCGVVFCSTKNRGILSNLSQTISRFGFMPREAALIIDDEADQASLNTQINRPANESSGVFRAIMDLRDGFERCTFVQVTATPQALLLQKAGDEFRPDFIVPFAPGRSYVGGEDFFGDISASNLIRIIPEAEPNQIDNNGPLPTGLAAPTGFRQAICSFLVGAAIKGIKNEGREFSCLFHISHSQLAHTRLEELSNSFLETAMNAFGAPPHNTERQLLFQFLQEAHQDLALTSAEELPAFTEVCELIDSRIGSANVQVLNAANPRNPIGGAFFNVFIGGNRLSRGVTIPRLLVTYYARNSRSPQLDTMLQHARMYGYRADDLDAIRFFTTEALHDLFRNITESDTQLHEALETPGVLDSIQPILLSRSNGGLLRPTRRNVLPLNELRTYMPGRRYFPYDPTPSKVATLDALLNRYVGLDHLVQVNIDLLREILQLTRSEPRPRESWNDEAILRCIENLKPLCENRGALVVRIDRNIRYGFRAMLDPDDENLFDPNIPTLTMYRFRGSVEQGWSGDPLWVPNLRFPDGNRYFMFTPTATLS